MQRRDFLLAGGLAGFAPFARIARAATVAPAKAAMPINVAINKSGRQRMLSQRCAKAWFMQRTGVLPDVASKILADSRALFESQLDELRGLQANEEVAGALTALGEAWRSYKARLGPEGDPQAVYFESDQVLAAAQRATVAYERVAGTQAGHLVNLSGRQRMLSQRLAKLHYCIGMRVGGDEVSRQFELARKEFVAAQLELGSAPQNTQEIRDELRIADTQWTFFDLAVQVRDTRDRGRAAADVATTSERILQQMDLVVGLYEKLAG